MDSNGIAQPSSSSSSSSAAETTNNSPVTRDYMETILREYERNDTLIVKDMISELALTFGDNCIADVFRVKVDGYQITKNGKVIEYSKFVIVKKPLHDDENIPSEMFKFESKVYDKVVVVLENHLKQKLPVIRPIKVEESIVVTEDFNDDGWVLSNRREGVNQEQSEKVMKALAMFHAASIVLANNDEIRFKKLSLHVQDQAYSETNAEMCKKTIADSYAVAKYFSDAYLPKANGDEAVIIEKFFSETSDDMYKKAQEVTVDTKVEDQIYVHGECWANNFMLKKDNSGDHALLLNLDTVCLASPARDLVYFFATNPQSVNKKPLIKAYIDELQKHLIEHKMPKNIIEKFSMKFIEDEMKRLRPVALLTAIWLLVAISFTSYPTVEDYNKLDRKDKPQLVMKHIDQEFYVRRLMEILLEYVE